MPRRSFNGALSSRRIIALLTAALGLLWGSPLWGQFTIESVSAATGSFMPGGSITVAVGYYYTIGTSVTSPCQLKLTAEGQQAPALEVQEWWPPLLWRGITLPANLEPGPYELTCSSNGVTSNSVTINVTLGQPAITAFSPAAVEAGSSPLGTIQGSGFGQKQLSGDVHLVGAAGIPDVYINNAVWSNTEIGFAIPANASIGTYQVVVHTDSNGDSSLPTIFTLTILLPPMPTGSYQQTCTDISVSSSSGTPMLSATCQTTSGLWMQTQLFNYEWCQQPPANLDGTLACNIGGTPPAGSYTQTCQNIWWDQGTLNAECQTLSGVWQQTSLQNASQCLQPPSNYDGTLACNMGGSPPTGSYTQTCRDVWVNSGTLMAECQTVAGTWVPTQLQNFSQCLQPPSNYDGTLACNIGGSPPAGSYTQTCRDVWVNSGTLMAECQTPSGQWIPTSLANYSSCLGPPVNLGGILACELTSPASGAGLPVGSYTQTCQDELVSGQSLTAICRTKSGSWINTSLSSFSFCSGGIANVNGILQCPTSCSVGASGPPQNFLVTGTQLADQEQSNWCWVASAQMVMGYFGIYVDQCTQVNGATGLTSCCGHWPWTLPVQYSDSQAQNCVGCNCGGYPPLSSYGLTGQGSSTPLTWSQLTAQLSCGNTPFWFAWNWGGGGAHVMVAYGYETVNGTQSVWILNPEDPDPVSDTYADWSTLPNQSSCPSSAYHCFQQNFTGIALQ